MQFHKTGISIGPISITWFCLWTRTFGLEIQLCDAVLLSCGFRSED